MKTSTPFFKRLTQALWVGAFALCPMVAKAQYWADANNDGILDYCITITPDSRVQVGFDPECCGKEYSVTYQYWGSANTHYYIQGYAGGQWHILNYRCLTNADLVTANWPEGQTCDTYGSYRCVALASGISVSISGDSSLWHYHGPYPQPNDEPSLAGYQYPAPVITLTASGTEANASYQWEITQGGDKINLESGANQKTVAIRGIAKSNQQGDITVRVTKTIDAQSATATAILTVREPTSINHISTVDQNSPPAGANFGYHSVITYEVRDQFGAQVGAGIAVDESLADCVNNFGPETDTDGSDGVTNAEGRITDRVGVGRTEGPIPGNYYKKIHQTFKIAGSGVVLNNVIEFFETTLALHLNQSCTP